MQANGLACPTVGKGAGMQGLNGSGHGGNEVKMVALMEMAMTEVMVMEILELRLGLGWKRVNGGSYISGNYCPDYRHGHRYAIDVTSDRLRL